MRTLRSLVFALTLPLLNCGMVTIRNNKFYADAGPIGAYWFMSISSDNGQITKLEWDEARMGMVCETPQVFADLKADLETLCQNNQNQCSYEDVSAANTFYNRILFYSNK